MAQYRLYARLAAAAAMVIPGETAADIGSDHMHLPAYLAEQGICPRVIATDKAWAPCQSGREFILSRGLGTVVEIRCGDGLQVLKPSEAATIILTGMGGCLIRDILKNDIEVALSAKRLVLSPQKNPELLRMFLAENGWCIREEHMVKEAGIYYPVICAVPGEMSLDPLEALYGPCLIRTKEPVFLENLRQQLEQLEEIEAGLIRSGMEKEHSRRIGLAEEKQRIIQILEGNK